MTTPTSYFSTPSTTLDPTLFEGRHLRSWVRQGINSLLLGFLEQKYRQPDTWAHPWLAGSGVSYQWEASRQPADLDCLVGVDFIQFRKSNPEMTGLSDKEISDQINSDFRTELQPETENWNGYELTFYVNTQATDIRAINPYAAYDVKYDDWTVAPNPAAQAPRNPEWETAADNDYHFANQIAMRFTVARDELSQARGDAARRNAETKLVTAVQQGTALFDDIHQNRSLAFSPMGEGYNDFNNYRWQAGKRKGTIQMLRSIKEHGTEHQKLHEQETYGAQLPDAHLTLRTSALYGRS